VGFGYTPFTSISTAYPMPPLSGLGRSELGYCTNVPIREGASMPASIAKKVSCFYSFPLLSNLQLVIVVNSTPERLEFWILVIRICFGFRASSFEFIEN